jgi:hypothetical protein
VSKGFQNTRRRVFIVSFKLENAGCFFLTMIFVFWDMIFNQVNHVHATAVVCKKTDAGYVAFLQGGNAFVPDCRSHCNAVENKQFSLTGV